MWTFCWNMPWIIEMLSYAWPTTLNMLVAFFHGLYKHVHYPISGGDKLKVAFAHCH